MVPTRPSRWASKLSAPGAAALLARSILAGPMLAKFMLAGAVLAGAALIVACSGPGGGTPASPGGADADAGSGDGQQVCTCATDQQCGLDPCGGSCGSCQAGDLCAGGQCVAAATCDTPGFVPTGEEAVSRTTIHGQVVRYTALTHEGATPFDRLTLTLLTNDEVTGPSEPGVYDLAGSQAGASPVWVTVEQGCSTEGTECTHTFVASAGQVNLGELGGALRADLLGLTLDEVYLDPKTGKSYPLPSGTSWCLPSYPIDVPLESVEVPGDCADPGDGNELGDRVGDMTLRACDGSERTLHARCGNAKAVWVLAVAGWCAACEQRVPEAAAFLQTNEARGLDLVILLGEDANENPPTPEYCLEYAQSHGVDPSMVYMDNIQGDAWADAFQIMDSYSGDSVSLPWEAVLRGYDLRYDFCNAHPDAGETDATTVIEGLLSE